MFPEYEPDSEDHFARAPSQPEIEDYAGDPLDEREVARYYLRLMDAASLDNSGLPPKTLARLRDPPREQPQLDDPDIKYILNLLMVCDTESSFEGARQAYQDRHPGVELMSRYKVSMGARRVPSHWVTTP